MTNNPDWSSDEFAETRKRVERIREEYEAKRAADIERGFGDVLRRTDIASLLYAYDAVAEELVAKQVLVNVLMDQLIDATLKAREISSKSVYTDFNPNGAADWKNAPTITLGKYAPTYREYRLANQSWVRYGYDAFAPLSLWTTVFDKTWSFRSPFEPLSKSGALKEFTEGWNYAAEDRRAPVSASPRIRVFDEARLREIKDRLSSITSFPWHECKDTKGDRSCSCGMVWAADENTLVVLPGTHEEADSVVPPRHVPANARFIAHAPQDIRDLLDMIEGKPDDDRAG